jgi:glutathione synthase/RimK-type ligase-like ATP-grasp enzyme
VNQEDVRATACVLNSGVSAWAFEQLAGQLGIALGVEVSSTPRSYNYVLGAERDLVPEPRRSFIDAETIELAGDKRTLATTFARAGVPTPETRLFEDLDAAQSFVAAHANREWCLKYPIGSGARGHRLFNTETIIPPEWPTPYVVQEFVRLEHPEVYRTYAASGELFGWLARRYTDGRGSPWVAHARGAAWVTLPGAPEEALSASRAALEATGLLETFGCVDLLQHPDGKWLVLEVGTDGLFNHVDRELGDPSFEAELMVKIRDSFWRRFEALRAQGDDAAP